MSECSRCYRATTLDPGSEDDGLCHGCAHLELDEARATIARLTAALRELIGDGTGTGLLMVGVMVERHIMQGEDAGPWHRRGQALIDEARAALSSAAG